MIKQPALKRILQSLLLFAALFSIIHASAAVPALASPSSRATGFVHTDGQQLIDPNGQPFFLRGLTFVNYVWRDDYLTTKYASKADYTRVRDLGMNHVYLCLSYLWIESDQKPGQYKTEFWEWLDQQIAWAKEAGIYVILNLDYAPGYIGGMSQLPYWNNPQNQARTAAIYKAMAQRYKDEPTVAGYDLLNEPMQIDASMWQVRAQELVNAIRSVDPNHMIVVQAINSYEPTFILVQDANILYNFHFYKPWRFVNDTADSLADGWRYPDENRLMFDWSDLAQTGQNITPALPTGDSDWKQVESPKMSPGQGANLVGIPTMQCSANTGKAYFGDFMIKEYDQSGSPAGTPVNVSIAKSAFSGNWSDDGQAMIGKSLHSPSGSPEGRSYLISKVRQNAVLDEPGLAFQNTPGHTYQISGWMKGEKVSAGAQCVFSIRWYLYANARPLMRFNKEYSNYWITRAAAFGKDHHVPVTLGEFGSNFTSMLGNSGGERWIADVIDICIANNLSFDMFGYNSFTMINDPNHNPDPRDANQNLLKMLRAKMAVDPKNRQP
jgi:endoglucanase